MEECFYIMDIYPGMSWDAAKSLEVPTRKWLIQRWNKQRESEQKNSSSPSVERPLTESERMKMIAQAQQPSTPKKPIDPSSFMVSRRNIPKK